MTVHLKKIIILFSALSLFTVACGKPPEHNNNQINQAQKQNSSQNQMNQ